MTEGSERNDARRRRGVWGNLLIRAIAALAIVASWGLLLVTLLAFGARLHWGLDLLAHFRVQAAAAAIAMAVMLLVLRRWKWAALPLLAAVVNAAAVLPAFLPDEHGAGRGRMYRAVSANVYTANDDAARFLAFIEAAQPVFFVVMEINEDWRRRLAPLAAEYPHSVVRTREDNFGIGLYSRVPLESAEVIEMTPAKLPVIVVVADLDDGPVTIIAAHPLPPVGRKNSELRNLQLAELGALAARLPDPKLLLGDLNVTPWSPHFADLVDRSRMRDARRGFGVQPTWPAAPWLLRIPIDHTLVSDGVHVAARRLGPNIGSDHLPVVLDFRLGAAMGD